MVRGTLVLQQSEVGNALSYKLETGKQHSLVPYYTLSSVLAVC